MPDSVANLQALDPQDDGRRERRARKARRRRRFGLGILTTFALVLGVVTLLLFVGSGFSVHNIAKSSLEDELERRLETVAKLLAHDLEANEYLVRRLREEQPRAQELANAMAAETKRVSSVRDVVIVDLHRNLLASASGSDAAENEMTRKVLEVNKDAIAQVAGTRKAACTPLYFYPEKVGRYYKSGYAPVVLGNEVALVVGVDFPADFREAVERVDSRFTLLGAVSLTLVLVIAVFLVRQRVQVPIYRLVRAMEGGDAATEPGPPVHARVRWRDEIGALTDHYNLMVDRLQAQETALRELAGEARRKAEYMGGFSKYLVEGVPTAFVAVDPGGLVTVWNEAATKILLGPKVGSARFARSVPAVEAIGRPVAEVLERDHPVARALAAGLRGEITDQALVPLGHAGDAETGESDQDEIGSRLVELDAGPFKNPATGELLGAAAFVHDRTELERLRRAAARNERLAAVGRLAAGLAHEIRNPLGAISGFAELIERKKGEDAQRLATRLRGEVDELNRFVTEFLAYARDQRIKRAPEDMTLLVKRATETALQAAGFTADEARRALDGDPVPRPGGGELKVAIDGDPELEKSAVDATALKAALVNIVKNAVEAMQGKGALAVRAKRTGSIAVIRVRDSGPGVPTDLREKIFDPFFTTREGGVGLGLAIAHKIVVAHGGKIAVRAPDEGGCEFVLRIQVAEGPGAEPPAMDEDLTPSTPVKGVTSSLLGQTPLPAPKA